MWGLDHDFSSLWPRQQTVDLTIQIPSNISVALNWNRLGAGAPAAHTIDQSSANCQKRNTTQIYKEKTPITEGSFSQHTGLRDPQYAHGVGSKVWSENRRCCHPKDGRAGGGHPQKTEMGSRRIPCRTILIIQNPGGLTNIGAVDPWKIKLALGDLDKAMKAKSKMIGAVLIIGCHEIVPFHKLPNPTDDTDAEVLSDNPYATTSGNYLSPEWPVGRFPGEKGNDAGLILEQLRHAIDFQKSTQQNNSFFSQAFSILSGRTNPVNLFRDLLNKPRDFGYTAAVWRRSSMAAFRPIGTGSDLRVCPQFDEDTIDVDNLMKAKCAYFNLHGIGTTPEWYGQRDYSENVQGPDFPVAISASKIPNRVNNIDLIVSEACYGGYIIDKTIDESMALKLISVGCQGFVGSTCVSYGSVYTPLIGADLFSFIMWKYTKDGYSFGEAFMQAKLGLINVMTQRQGYLDGEDQKTLLSFVLYGDPLGYLEPNIYMDKSMGRDGHNAEIKTVSDQDGALTQAPRISKEVAANLNEMMATYLPSLSSASMKVREHKIRINKVIQSGAKEAAEGVGDSSLAFRTQVTYSQKTKVAHNTHEQFARVTLDEDGKVIKLAVSR